MIDLITGDLQLTDNPRDGYRHTFMRRLPVMADECKCQRIVILGDLTEEKDRHPAALVNLIVRHFHELAKDGREVVILRGNHDYLDEANPFFRFLRRFERIRFINKPAAIAGDLFLPHTNNYQRDWAGLDFTAYRHIFAHNIFAGAKAASGIELNGVPLSVFPPAAQVIAGDVHNPQQVGCVTYVGAPYRVDFGDDYEPRMIRLDGDGIASLPVRGIPQKRLVEIAWPTARWPGGPARGDILKVRVEVRPAQMAKWPEIRGKIQAWADRHGYVIYLIQPIVQYQPGRPVTVSERRDDAALVQAYGRQRDLDSHTVAVGLAIVNKENT